MVMSLSFAGNDFEISFLVCSKLLACSAKKEFIKIGGSLEEWAEEVEELVEEEGGEGSSNNVSTGINTESALRAERSRL
jgi:hypothetical protein